MSAKGVPNLRISLFIYFFIDLWLHIPLLLFPPAKNIFHITSINYLISKYENDTHHGDPHLEPH